MGGNPIKGRGSTTGSGARNRGSGAYTYIPSLRVNLMMFQKASIPGIGTYLYKLYVSPIDRTRYKLRAHKCHGLRWQARLEVRIFT